MYIRSKRHVSGFKKRDGLQWQTFQGGLICANDPYGHYLENDIFKNQVLKPCDDKLPSCSSRRRFVVEIYPNRSDSSLKK